MNRIFLILSLLIFISCKNNAAQKANNDNKTTTEMNLKNRLEGNWELVELPLQNNHFDSLYNERIPYITFDISNKRLSGNTSCNFINAELKIDGNKIDFTVPIVMTKMFCPGEGENIFMENLHKINSFDIHHDTLDFKIDNLILMKFKNKTVKK